MQKLLSRDVEFTGILAYNDAMASGAMTMLQDNNIAVPQDVSVIGFDDVLLAKYCRPKLTTLHYPVEMMAGLATRLALDFAMGKSGKEETHKYTPTLIPRQSVAVPR